MDKNDESQEVRRREMYKASIHEAAHAVIMHLLGEQLCDVRIFPNVDRKEHERTWLGQVRGRCFKPHNEIIVGLVGEIAALYDEDMEVTADDCFSEFFEMVEGSAISDSDLDYSKNFTPKDVVVALDMLRKHWSVIEKVAMRLREEKVLGWSVVADIVQKRR